MTRSTNDHAASFEQLRRLRAEALEHARTAQRLAIRRRDLIRTLTEAGVSQAEIAREMGVTRQAVQKMASV